MGIAGFGRHHQELSNNIQELPTTFFFASSLLERLDGIAGFLSFLCEDAAPHFAGSVEQNVEVVELQLVPLLLA